MTPTDELHVSAYPLTKHCWQLDRRPSDEYTPHFATEDEALTEAARWVEDNEPIPAVAQLPAPCWVAACASCGADVEHTEYGLNLHYPTSAAVDVDAPDLMCAAGCEPPDLDGRTAHLAQDPSMSMDPLPGLEDTGCELDTSPAMSTTHQIKPQATRHGHEGHSQC